MCVRLKYQQIPTYVTLPRLVVLGRLVWS